MERFHPISEEWQWTHDQDHLMSLQGLLQHRYSYIASIYTPSWLLVHTEKSQRFDDAIVGTFL